MSSPSHIESPSMCSSPDSGSSHHEAEPLWSSSAWLSSERSTCSRSSFFSFFIQLVAQILEEDVLRSLRISSWRVRRQRGEGAPASEPKTDKALVVLTAPCIGRRAPPANAIMSNVAGTSVHSLGARLLPLPVQYPAAILTLGLIVVACGAAQIGDRLRQ